jgi:hypothetical protein
MNSSEPATRVESFAHLSEIPRDAAALFDTAGTFFSTRAWWEAMVAHAIPPGMAPVFLLMRQNGVASGLFPMLSWVRTGVADAGPSPSSLPGPARTSTSLLVAPKPWIAAARAAVTGCADPSSFTTPYTCIYEPLIARDADRPAVFRAFARRCRASPVTRIDSLDHVVAVEFTAGAKDAGLSAARFDHFGNWHENVAGLDWSSWLARRHGALRETIRRRARRAEHLEGARFHVFRDQDEIAAGIAAFETVYARSWKEPEPFPDINPGQIRAAASMGLARVGVWWIGEDPAAAQFWFVEHGAATVLKLAHDEAFKAHSPGTVLTAWMVRYMLEHEHVTELDFGRGDDDYKRGWVAERRQRVGLLLINPWRPHGALALARHALGRMRRIVHAVEEVATRSGAGEGAATSPLGSRASEERISP